MDAASLVSLLLARAGSGERLLVAIAGAPGSGKSTLAHSLCERLNKALPGSAVVMPMDGFHYDNGVLEPMGLLPRKGAPETFDAEGLIATVARIKAAMRDVAIAVFDRASEMSRACAAIVRRDTPVVLIEGNYLLLDREPWNRLKPLFDLTVFIDVPESVLEERLVARWLQYGFPPQDARRKALQNDIPNARLVAGNSLPADIVITGG
jgi:pantothenate kinase